MSDYYERMRAFDEWDGVSPFTPIDWDGSFDCIVCGGTVQGPVDMFENCPTCGWEDDPIQRRDHEYTGGPNAGVSVEMAKDNYARCGYAMPSRNAQKIQALIEAGEILPTIEYYCEVCSVRMPGYFAARETCPECGWGSNYAGKYLDPECVTEWGTLEEARIRYQQTGTSEPSAKG